MSKRKKLLERLFSKPKDFTWSELQSLLTGYGYKEISGTGSRLKFYESNTGNLISLHKPHPGNIVKTYVLDRVIKVLEGRGIRP